MDNLEAGIVLPLSHQLAVRAEGEGECSDGEAGGETKMKNWTFMQWIIAIIVIAAAICIMLVALPAMGLEVPHWLMQMFWIVVVAAAAIIAIGMLVKLWNSWGSLVDGDAEQQRVLRRFSTLIAMGVFATAMAVFYVCKLLGL